MNIANHVERVARQAPGRQAIVFEGRDIGYGALDACAGAGESVAACNAFTGRGTRSRQISG